MFDNAMLFIVVCCLPSLLSRETMPGTRGTRDLLWRRLSRWHCRATALSIPADVKIRTFPSLQTSGRLIFATVNASEEGREGLNEWGSKREWRLPEWAGANPPRRSLLAPPPDMKRPPCVLGVSLVASPIVTSTKPLPVIGLFSRETHAHALAHTNVRTCKYTQSHIQTHHSMTHSDTQPSLKGTGKIYILWSCVYSCMHFLKKTNILGLSSLAFS